MRIEPKIKEYCNVREALEYLGLGWKPYIDNDERLVDSEREKIRIPFNDKRPRSISPNQERYFDCMHMALAIFQNLVRNKLIKLYLLEVDEMELYSKAFDEDEMSKEKTIEFIQRGSISSAYVVFGNIDEDYKDIRLFSGVDYRKYDYCTVVENEYGTFFCHEWPNLIKFSEIEPYYEGETSSQRENIDKIINDVSYTTPLIDIVNMLVSKYGDKINQEKSDTVYDFIEREEKAKGYKFSGNERNAIFRVIRKPETKKGGAKKQIKH